MFKINSKRVKRFTSQLLLLVFMFSYVSVYTITIVTALAPENAYIERNECEIDDKLDLKDGKIDLKNGQNDEKLTRNHIYEAPKYLNCTNYYVNNGCNDGNEDGKMDLRDGEIEYYDVPLDNKLQKYIIELCDSRNIDHSIVISMIKKESYFTETAIGDNGNSFGLMQIQPRWHQERMDRLGCVDLLNGYYNVTVGVDILVELSETGNSIEWILMAYNGGPSYANEKEAVGEVSEYAQKVLFDSKNLKKKS